MHPKYPTTVALSYKDQLLTNNNHYQRYIDTICESFLPVNRPARICEWGAGFSTFTFYDLLTRRVADCLVSIDNNKDYAECFWKHLAAIDGFYPVIRNEIGPTSGNADIGLHYASHPVSHGIVFDLIFIDGRRRMECALNSLLFADLDTIIVIDDGLRSRYQVARLMFMEIATLDHGVVYKIKDSVFNAIQVDRLAILEQLALQGLVIG